MGIEKKKLLLQQAVACKKQRDMLCYREGGTAYTVGCLSGKLAQEATPPSGNVWEWFSYIRLFVLKKKLLLQQAVCLQKAA